MSSSYKRALAPYTPIGDKFGNFGNTILDRDNYSYLDPYATVNEWQYDKQPRKHSYRHLLQSYEPIGDMFGDYGNTIIDGDNYKFLDPYVSVEQWDQRTMPVEYKEDQRTMLDDEHKENPFLLPQNERQKLTNRVKNQQFGTSVRGRRFNR
jgi:hypothetical protein